MIKKYYSFIWVLIFNLCLVNALSIGYFNDTYNFTSFEDSTTWSLDGSWSYSPSWSSDLYKSAYTPVCTDVLFINTNVSKNPYLVYDFNYSGSNFSLGWSVCDSCNVGGPYSSCGAPINYLWGDNRESAIKLNKVLNLSGYSGNKCVKLSGCFQTGLNPVFNYIYVDNLRLRQDANYNIKFTGSNNFTKYLSFPEGSYLTKAYFNISNTIAVFSNLTLTKNISLNSDIAGRSIWANSSVIFAQDSNNNLIQFDYSGQNRTLFDTDSFGSSAPFGMWFNGSTFFINDNVDQKIYVVLPNGTLVSEINHGISNTRGLWGNSSNIWITEISTDEVYKINYSGSTISSFDTSIFGGNCARIYGNNSDFWILDETSSTVFHTNITGGLINSIPSSLSSNELNMLSNVPKLTDS
jgi:hypothetical protein